jgi:hypothetical protein
MTLRDIFCSDCSAVAVSVKEGYTAEQLDGTPAYCLACDSRGVIRSYDDGEACGVEFKADKPVPYTVGDLFGELERQVNIERERQLIENQEWFTTAANPWTKPTFNARHAKRLAGWPSGEWQGIREAQ